MSTRTSPQSVDPTSTLKLVARHLVAAEACALRAAATSPDLGDVAVGAALLTSQVLALLPREELIDDVATPDGDDVGALLRAAERLTRSHPVGVFPPGTAAFVADLGDLIAQVSA